MLTKLPIFLIFTVIFVCLAGYGQTAGHGLKSCDGKICKADEFCSNFNEKCEKCQTICDESTHNFHANDCLLQCPGYNKTSTLEDEIAAIKARQIVIMVLLIIILLFLIARYTPKFVKWLRSKKSFSSLMCKMKKKSIKKPTSNPTVQIPKLNSQGEVYNIPVPEISSVQSTMTSSPTRHPAESTLNYSYDNKGLQITPSP